MGWPMAEAEAAAGLVVEVELMYHPIAAAALFLIVGVGDMYCPTVQGTQSLIVEVELMYYLIAAPALCLVVEVGGMQHLMVEATPCLLA